MPFRSILILLILLVGMLLSMTFLGMQTSYYVLSILLILQAIIFSARAQWYDKFIQFMNPKLYNIYLGKGPEFIRKNRIINIIAYYVLSVIFFLNTEFMAENRYLPVNWLGTMGFLSLILVAIGYLVNVFILKKSRSNREYLIWSFLFSHGVSIIIVISLLSYFFSTTIN